MLYGKRFWKNKCNLQEPIVKSYPRKTGERGEKECKNDTINGRKMNWTDYDENKENENEES